MVRFRSPAPRGRIPEWPKGADCKSVVDDFDGSNPSPPTRKTALFSAVFSWRRRMNSHPMLTRFFCLHELRMQIRCRKTAIPLKALLLSSAFLLANPAHSVNKITDYSRIPSSNAKERYLLPAFRPYNVRSRISYSSQSRLSAPNRN